MRKVIVVLAGLALLLGVQPVRAQDDDGPSAQVETDSSGDSTVTTDNGAGAMTQSSGDDPVEIDNSEGDAVGTVTVQPDDPD